MTTKLSFSKTYIDDAQQWKLIEFLQKHFITPQPELIAQQLVEFIGKYPPALEDFPYLEGRYTRTVILRHESGFEAMVARWSKGTTSPIHGHPWFNLYCIVRGCLEMDDYIKKEEGLTLISSGELRKNDVSFFVGKKGTFDNNIHQVRAREETLSIHISSDDPTKGQIFS